VRHRANPRFWRAYEQLPEDIRRLADRNYELLKRDPRHPSLHLKKVGRFWSVRVGLFYRALALEAEDDLVWFWIGRHDDYERLIGLARPGTEGEA
jgi:hypothetical protein